MERAFYAWCGVRSMSGDGRLNWGQKPAGLKIDFGIVLIVSFALAGMVLSLVLAAQLLAL
jgi:hypothetical protein